MNGIGEIGQETSSMPRIGPRTAIVSLFALLASGCASQNAMQLVPAEVKLDMARGKVSRPDAEKPAPKGVAPAKSPNAGPDLAALRKLADGARGGAALAEAKSVGAGRTPTRTSPVQPMAENGPRELFEQALAAQDGGQDETDGAGNDAWRRLLALGARKSASPPVDGLTTASVAAAPAASEPVGVAFSQTGDELDRDSEIRLRLMKRGGRTAQRIVVGRIDAGEPHAAMEQAAARGRLIAAIVGGDPAVGYDPAAPAGSATILYGTTGKVR